MTSINKRERPFYYSGIDLIGIVLSNWRTLAISRMINSSSLLDIACGDNRLVKKLGFGTGVDIYPFKGGNIVAKDLTKIPLPSETYDFITMIASLNYVDDPRGVLKEVARLLSPNGTLLASMPDKRIAYYWHKIRDRKLRQLPFDEQELNQLLEGSGLFLLEKKRFMFGMNRIYVIKKR